jgi:hypothetical protein
VVLHAPELGQGGHVHHVGLDQFIGPHYIEYDKARTDTKVTIAAERLALIAVLTLPITALSSVYGMNIIVNDQTDFAHLAVVLAAMMAISAVLLRWAKQQGWWWPGPAPTSWWSRAGQRPWIPPVRWRTHRWPGA